MRQLFLWVTTLLLVDLATADEWLCKREASQMEGDAVKACGIGYGINEAEARRRAFYAAQLEFWRLCHISSNCKGHDVSVEPGRLECVERALPATSLENYKKWTCHRLLTFTVDKTKTHNVGPRDDYPEDI